ncbi:MAG: SIMPL domain-containing protein [Clostridia bacterium]|nr:SIMPL domain-containing protein [Clostridia bacterium]
MMKKTLGLLVAVMLLCSICACALAEDDRVLRVSGNATVSLAADHATLQIGVNTRKDSVTEAQQENAALMQAVLSAIQQMGIVEKDLITSQFSVYGGFDISYDSLGREQRRNYYQVENMLSVTVRDLNQIGAVLDAAMAAGANTTYGITFASTQENEAYQLALTRAVQDAMAKAQVLSDAAGKTLGDLTLIDASQNSYHYGVSNVYSAKEAAGDTAIISGDVSVTADVVLEYTFQ